MKLIPELQGLRTIQSVNIALIHLAMHYTMIFPIESVQVSSPDDSPPPSLLESMISFGLGLLPKVLVDPFFMITGALLAMQTFEFLDSANSKTLASASALAEQHFKCVLRRALRLWTLVLPVLLLCGAYLSSTDGIVERLLFVNSTHGVASHLWSNAVTMQAAATVPIILYILDKIFVDKASTFESKMRIRVKFLSVCFVLTTAVRCVSIFSKFPVLSHRIDYIHSGPIMDLTENIVPSVRQASGLEVLPWEGSDAAKTFIKEHLDIIFETYLPYHMRIASFFAGALVGCLAYHGFCVSNKVADLLCAVAFVCCALADHCFALYPDFRFMLSFTYTTSQVFLGVLLMTATMRRGYIGCLVSKFLCLTPLQWFAPRSFALFCVHYVVGMVLAPRLTGHLGLSAPSFDTALPIVFAMLVISAFIADAAHRWIEVPVYRFLVRATYMDQTDIAPTKKCM